MILIAVRAHYHTLGVFPCTNGILALELSAFSASKARNTEDTIGVCLSQMGRPPFIHPIFVFAPKTVKKTLVDTVLVGGRVVHQAEDEPEV